MENGAESANNRGSGAVSGRENIIVERERSSVWNVKERKSGELSEFRSRYSGCNFTQLMWKLISLKCVVCAYNDTSI